MAAEDFAAADAVRDRGEEVAFVAGGVVDGGSAGAFGDDGGDVGEGRDARRDAGPGGFAGAFDEELEQVAGGGLLPKVVELLGGCGSPAAPKAAATAPSAASALVSLPARANQRRSAPVTWRARPWRSAHCSSSRRAKRGRRAIVYGGGESGSRRRQLLGVASDSCEAGEVGQRDGRAWAGVWAVMRLPCLDLWIVTHPALLRLDTVY